MNVTLALARRWRPKNFTELVGQEHVVRAISNALTQNRLHHAYLLTGTRGVGKTTLARIIAKALNCETGVTATPCGKCTACVEIDSGRFLDLIELDAASNTQVDNMRELLENALYAPTSGRFKVYIIDEVHMLSRSAFNAMLKTLEEPPAHVKFILATTDPQKVPVTVLSRCLQFNLKQIPLAQIRGQLEYVLGKENVTFEVPALNLLARAAQGSMRDALSLLDQAIAHGAGKVEETSVREMLGAVDRGYLFSILNALTRGDGPALLAEADRMAARSLSFDTALQELATLLHRIALAQTVPDALADDEPERDTLIALGRAFSEEDVQLLYQIAIHGRRDLGLAPDEFAGFTMTLMRMLAFLPLEPGGKVAPNAEKPAVTRVVEQPRAVEKTNQPVAGTRPIEAELSDWRNLVGRIKVGGMARMLGDNCEFRALQGDNIDLVVPEAHKHLLEKAYTDKLQAAIGDYFGRKLRLRISTGGSGKTPAEIENQERQAKLAKAIESIDSDPFVRELVENFDARVKDTSIKPVQ
ncbi:MAG: DNA polymerase III subunit gamma/tau [Betaproteobacteria bacterium]|nr:DNA polymerase III subunit gamma/tau [Betaproteobacteria bacterium]